MVAPSLSLYIGQVLRQPPRSSRGRDAAGLRDDTSFTSKLESELRRGDVIASRIQETQHWLSQLETPLSSRRRADSRESPASRVSRRSGPPSWDAVADFVSLRRSGNEQRDPKQSVRSMRSQDKHTTGPWDEPRADGHDSPPTPSPVGRLRALPPSARNYAETDTEIEADADPEAEKEATGFHSLAQATSASPAGRGRFVWESKLTALRLEVQRLRGAVGEEAARASNAEETAAAAKAAARDGENELQRLRADLRVVREERDASEHRAALGARRMEDQVAETERCQREADRHLERATRAEAGVQRLREEGHEATQRASEAEALVRQLRHDVDAQTRRAKDAESRVAELQSASHDQWERISKLEELRRTQETEMHAKSARVLELESTVAREAATVEQLEGTIARLEASAQSAADHQARLQEELEDARNRGAEQDTEAARLRDESRQNWERAQAAEERAKAAREEVQRVRQESQETWDRASQAELALIRLRETSEANLGRAREAERRILAVEADAKRLREALQESRRAETTAQQRLQALEGEHDQLREEIRKEQKEKAALEQALQEQHSAAEEVGRLCDEIRGLETKLHSSETAARELRVMNKKLRRRLRAADGSVSAAREEEGGLRHRIAVLEAALGTEGQSDVGTSLRGGMGVDYTPSSTGSFAAFAHSASARGSGAKFVFGSPSDETVGERQHLHGSYSENGGHLRIKGQSFRSMPALREASGEGDSHHLTRAATSVSSPKGPLDRNHDTGLSLTTDGNGPHSSEEADTGNV